MTTAISTIAPRASVTTGAPLLDGLYHLGFVTCDLEAAQERLACRYGIKRFRVKREPGYKSTAHAYAGNMMIEITQPEWKASPVYLEAMPTSGIVELHHLGHLVPDLERWAEIEAIVQHQGWETPSRGAAMDGHLRYLFVDARCDLGYYLEYVCLTGPALRIYDDVPAN